MNYIYIILTISIALAIAMLIFESKKQPQSKFITKTLASLFFVFSAFFALFVTNNFELILLLLVEAMLLCLLGDIFLCIEDIANDINTKLIQAIGMAFFMLAHLAYLMFFIYLSGFIIWLIFIIPSLPIIIFVLEKLKVIELKQILYPVLIYSAVIAAVLMGAINLIINRVTVQSALLIVATTLFVMSDLFLLFYNFGKKKPYLFKILCIIPYYLAQGLFALSIIYN